MPRTPLWRTVVLLLAGIVLTSSQGYAHWQNDNKTVGGTTYTCEVSVEEPDDNESINRINIPFDTDVRIRIEHGTGVGGHSYNLAWTLTLDGTNPEHAIAGGYSQIFVDFEDNSGLLVKDADVTRTVDAGNHTCEGRVTINRDPGFDAHDADAKDPHDFTATQPPP